MIIYYPKVLLYKTIVFFHFRVQVNRTFILEGHRKDALVCYEINWTILEEKFFTLNCATNLHKEQADDIYK